MKARIEGQKGGCGGLRPSTAALSRGSSILCAVLFLHSAALLCQSSEEPSAASWPGKKVLAGEVLPKPQHLAVVVAPLWGRIYPEKTAFPGARVKKGQKLAEIVLELNAVERLPMDDRTLDIDAYVELARHKLRFALQDYQRALKIKSHNPDFEAEAQRRKSVYFSRGKSRNFRP